MNTKYRGNTFYNNLINKVLLAGDPSDAQKRIVLKTVSDDPSLKSQRVIRAT
jgi:hypothetical protein